MRKFLKFGGILQYAHSPLLQLHELVLLHLLEGYRIKVVLDQLLEPPPVEPRLMLPLSHSDPL